MQYKITYCEKEAIFDSLDAAKKVAGEIFEKTGIVIGIERA